MLNISSNSIKDKFSLDQYSAYKQIVSRSLTTWLIKIITIMGLVAFASLFLPWTQNIRSKGYVTTLNPDQRPQTVQALIGGKIENWYVREGQPVYAGDTILRISEVKEEYLDPQILNRTRGQIDAKDASVSAYRAKARNLQDQFFALNRARDAKLEQNKIKMLQTRLKLESDSMDMVAARIKSEIALNQFERMSTMYDEGLKSLTDLENKRLSYQEAQAKVVSLQNKVNEQRNELINLNTAIQAINNEYQDKIAKSLSEKQSAISDAYEATAQIEKLQSNYNAYAQRQDNYFIKSPIDGIITKAISNGIGEIIKNGEEIVSIMPANYQLAVEMYVKPIDMPLLEVGQEVRIQFDGWPAIVFSGWPNSSYGTYAGRIFAIDNFISENGQYRILVAENPDNRPWPREIRVGGGVNTITLLKNVRLGYEIWRQLNGFPPDFYKESSENALKAKAPLRKVK